MTAIVVSFTEIRRSRNRESGLYSVPIRVATPLV